jgi:diguanylate cyclase (GGDEF)-like protein
LPAHIIGEGCVSAQEARDLRDAFAKAGANVAAGSDMFARFPTLEHQFRLEYANNHAASAMIATAIYLALLAIVTAANMFGQMSPAPGAPLGLIIFLRLGVAGPALVAIMLAIELRSLRAYYQSIVVVAALTLGTSVMTISAIMASAGQLQFQMGDVLVVCYTCLFLGLLGRVVVIVATGLVAAFLLLGIIYGVPGDALMFAGSVIVVTSLMTVVSSLRVERLSRRNFLENRFLNEIAERDGLTGLYNRRKFDELARMVWNQARREGRRLQVLFVDIDCFKSYNDANGHQAGDECIRRVARIIDRAARRPLDFSARYGGEEFVLVLFGADSAEPCAVAESIRAAIEHEAIPHPASDVSDFITVSVGSSAVKPNNSRTLSGLIQQADESLYAAKQAGRNLVVHEDVDEYGNTGSFEIPSTG